MKIGFAGTPDFAATILTTLIEGGRQPSVVYTRRDKPKGRGRKLIPSPVKTMALAHDITIEQPGSLRNAERQATFSNYQLDLFIVAAYGLILPSAILAAPRLGCLNVHASLLPRWRGAAPIERAILAGDEVTGVSLMQMDEGLDTGAVYSTHSVPITDTTTGEQLTQELAALGGQALLDLLPELEGQTPIPQDNDLATYAEKLTNADCVIDWHASAHQIARQVRALAERDPATCHRDDIRMQVLAATVAPDAAKPIEPLAPGTIIAAHKKAIEVATGDGVLALTRMKINRGKGSPMGPADLLNGYRAHFEPGATLS